MTYATDGDRRDIRRPSAASSLASVPYSAHFNSSFSSNYRGFGIGTINSPLEELTYNATSVIGSGAFGVVYAATVVQTGELVAIKKVFLDPRFKNREVQILSQLSHPNIVQLYNYFYTTQQAPDSNQPYTNSTATIPTYEAHNFVENKETNLAKTTSENSTSNNQPQTQVFLHLVMEFVPDTLSNLIKHYRVTLKQLMPTFLVQSFTLQLFSALAYLHSLNIVHRDIKPQNALIDLSSTKLKLADFGSAKVIKQDEPNTTYICSRFYRAPELLCGAVNYATEIDIWAATCVFAEMIILNALFPGSDHVDQLMEIIKVLGTPTREDILELNPLQVDIDLPFLQPLSDWRTLFSVHVEHRDLVSDLLHRLLVYKPSQRLKATEVQLHPYFNPKVLSIGNNSNNSRNSYSGNGGSSNNNNNFAENGRGNLYI